MIRECVNAGLARAKDNGSASGAVRSSRLSKPRIRALKIGRTLGVGTSAVQRVLLSQAD